LSQYVVAKIKTENRFFCNRVGGCIFRNIAGCFGDFLSRQRGLTCLKRMTKTQREGDESDSCGGGVRFAAVGFVRNGTEQNRRRAAMTTVQNIFAKLQIAANPNDVKAARALIAFLKGPAIDPGLAADHMVKGSVVKGGGWAGRR
jgi:hypothetical protein